MKLRTEKRMPHCCDTNENSLRGKHTEQSIHFYQRVKIYACRKKSKYSFVSQNHYSTIFEICKEVFKKSYPDEFFTG